MISSFSQYQNPSFLLYQVIILQVKQVQLCAVKRDTHCVCLSLKISIWVLKRVLADIKICRNLQQHQSSWSISHCLLQSNYLSVSIQFSLFLSILPLLSNFCPTQMNAALPEPRSYSVHTHCLSLSLSLSRVSGCASSKTNEVEFGRRVTCAANATASRLSTLSTLL